MKIAIPQFKDEIAPRFDAAAHFSIYTIEGKHAISAAVILCAGGNGLDRVRRLRDESIDFLICGGINKKYKYILQAEGIVVISRVTGAVSGALKAFIAGELSQSDESPIFRAEDVSLSLADLVDWSMNLFKKCGYRVFPGEHYAPLPVDFIAEILCPICAKPIRVAVCCGMHLYRIDEEIRQFHYAAGSAFNAQIYIHSADPKVQKTCGEFGIQLLDPGEYPASSPIDETAALPIVKPPVAGHDSL